MTDLDAILAAILADPHDDTPRLVYADVLDDLAATAECGQCEGRGRWRPPDAHGDRVKCHPCRGSGSVSNGMAERAEFIREQCELARLPELVPANVLCHQVEWEHFAGRLSGSGGKVRFEPPAPGSSSGVGVLHYERRNPDREPLERRERELWVTHGGEWLRDMNNAGFIMSTEANTRDARLAVVRRGFVDELRLPMAAFVGDRCPVCDIGPGVRRYPTQGGDWTEGACDHCHGTGRVGLDLAAVFAVHPIARVVLADREPTAASHQSGAWHWTWAENDADSRVGLPRKLMAALSASGINGPFDTRDAAMDGLSLACVNLGRAAAGLPPLA